MLLNFKELLIEFVLTSTEGGTELVAKFAVNSRNLQYIQFKLLCWLPKIVPTFKIKILLLSRQSTEDSTIILD